MIITVTRQASGANGGGQLDCSSIRYWWSAACRMSMGAASYAARSCGVSSMRLSLFKRPAEASSTTSNFLGVVSEEGPDAASGMSWAKATAAAPRKAAAAADTAVTLAGAEEVSLDTNRPRPDGRLLRAAARRLARRPNAMVQNAWPGRVQFTGPFSL